MAEKNKRVYDRMPFATPVRLRTPAALEGSGIDLGIGGVAVRVPTAVSEGSAVEVNLFRTGEPVPGTVRWSAPHPAAGFRLGIKWQEENGHLVTAMRQLAL